MPKYIFTAVDSKGTERTGSVEAASVDLASAQIKSMGYFPTNLALEQEKRSVGESQKVKKVKAVSTLVKKKKKPLTFGKVINQKSLTIFTRQLSTLIQAGLPLLRGLEVLAKQERHEPFRYVIVELYENIRSGNTFSEGLQQHPKTFSRLYVNMVKAGEAGGILDVVLNRLALFMEKSQRIKGKIRAAMVYPVIVVILAVLVVSALMAFVVPQFESIFRDMLKGASLPVLTQVVLDISSFIKTNIVSTICLIVGFVVVLKLLSRTRVGARSIDWAVISLPLVGNLYRKAAISRFSRTFGTLLSSGVPILSSLLITRDTSGNALLVEAINKVHDRVKEGEGVSGPLEATKIFPLMVTSMIDVGEETGELPEMLNRVAEIYDEEVDNAVAGLTSIIEPIMIVFLALTVGTIVIALFLPIIEIIEQLN
ncbi:MAG: type II secretion system F family protein [Opitutaceae bacterium]|nr:type II secretion system F family protein [Opitutaceae bacterium]